MTNLADSFHTLVGRPAVRRLMTVLGPLLGLIVVFGLFAAADAAQARAQQRDATFLSEITVKYILRDASQVGVAALGMTLIIIAGGIDLSAGTAIALCATVTAWFFRENYSTAVALLAGIATGCAAGFLNGTLIGALRVVPFIVTLGTMTIFLGLGLILAEDTPIRAHSQVPAWIVDLQVPYPPVDAEWMLVPMGVWVMLLLALLVAGVLHFTVFGRHIFAVGSNAAAARLCGIRVGRMRILVYTLAGFFVGVAGIFQFAFLGGEGNPNDGAGKELEVIAAVVIGGGSLSGGRGSVLGTLSGACIMATILQGCVTLDIGTSYRQVIVGCIIIAAVALDQVRQRRLMAG
ncbi:MAG: ABC transporter permease [Planctomycetes bacterium]|nr:ABC transporter permease [Planctomycetota bacterium]